MTKLNEDYSKLEQSILDKYRKELFYNLTSIQEQSYKVLAQRSNALLVAPTGSGKTEAAILPVISLIAINNERNTSDNKSKRGIKCLYITPQRSLNNDVFRRIIKYATSEEIDVQIRHGDTTYSKRKKIIENPPEILITTPESLGVILVNEKMNVLLRDVEWVIIDEIHEIMPSKRGAYLSLCLERLTLISTEFCRIGISATIGNISDTAKFLVGKNRKCEILIDKSLRKYDLELKFVQGSIKDTCNHIIKYISQDFSKSSVLLFTNTRDESEFLGTVLKDQSNIPIQVHHGSLSKDAREETEQFLRRGFNGIVVCTSSLELGLDIGSIDLVIHYGSPRQVSKLIQRIGRSRHTRHTSAKGLIITNNYDDYLESMSIIQRVNMGSIEEQQPHECSLDVLAHNIVGSVLQEKKPLDLRVLYETLKSAFLYKSLSFYDYNDCINILINSYLLRIERDKNLIFRTGKSLRYYYENVSTIPHVSKFEVIDSISNRKIGTLDQQFVGDYGEKGNVFVLKGSQWRILVVNETKFQVHVEPLMGAPINIPYWVGETIPVDYETARIVGQIRKSILSSSSFDPKKYYLSNLMTSEIHSKLAENIKPLKIIPNSNDIVIESVASEDVTIIHCTLGTKVNNTLGSLLSTFISSRTGHVVEYRADPYRILLSSVNSRITKEHIISLFTDEFDVESVLIASFTGTYNINWKVWMVAKRFGLIQKESVYDKRLARLLYDRYRKTSLSKESIRELIHDKYDVNNTKTIVKKIKNGFIKLHWNEDYRFSGLSQPILNRSKKSISTPIGMESGILELIKERLTNTKHKLICVRCAKWERIFETHEIPDKLSCPFCKSRLITATFWKDVELRIIIGQKLAGETLSRVEENKFDRAWKLASLINNFGKLAIFVLSGHGIGVDTCARLLRNFTDEQNLLKSIYEAEKQYVMTRGFWDN
ncbi:MAG: DEAD/DEAH box helicase [Candidatus Nitrosocosmicus sp.]|uniref:DEAD/DEAH box helicase n=1 Tax=Candidatus Nitrosocosmicus agrestis TaxID=2563600 RepID=UPI00125A1D2B|nr:DEAD/DEAH box helicase [Candidatus Nitrosocosmicus sp. SS]KAA2281958.1 DEAD/DEAH box helicase [Candidatus Nitrosocosmicus sp. SS]KAF0869863.1 DEAD/DEAH box helicase [Candidatus Nitrosocosmicus sp. SS]MDR4490655.1 DEAD/DEAH box helicase [Candidatus Nitrosocosmicus sp.]